MNLELKEIVRMTTELQKLNTPTRSEGKNSDQLQKRDYFVNVKRIEELSTIINPDFDLSKLIRLCEEINFSYSNNCFFSVITLCRALLDHIPPIFQVKNFTEIANNYRGGKSFRDAMQHLDNTLKKIADTHIHSQIKKVIVLPNIQQVNFISDIDFLLAEIIELLR